MSDNLQNPLLNQVLRSLEESNRQQVKIMKRQLLLTRITALLLAVTVAAMIWVGASMLPKVQTVLTNLNTISAQLASADLYATTQKIDILVESGQQSITEASDKLSELDVKTLNEAIKILYEAVSELRTVTEPLGRMFGR